MDPCGVGRCLYLTLRLTLGLVQSLADISVGYEGVSIPLSSLEMCKILVWTKGLNGKKAV